RDRPCARETTSRRGTRGSRPTRAAGAGRSSGCIPRWSIRTTTRTAAARTRTTSTPCASRGASSGDPRPSPTRPSTSISSSPTSSPREPGGRVSDPHREGHDPAHRSEDLALRVEAIESLLVEKGLVDPATVDEIVRYYEEDVGPMHGARVVARAWVDPEYRRRLLADATATVAELGIGGPAGGHPRVPADTPP